MGHHVTVLTAKTRVHEPPFEMYEGMRLYHKKVLPDRLLQMFPAAHYFPMAVANLTLMFHLLPLINRERFDLVREDISPFPPSGLLALFPLPVKTRVGVIHNLQSTLSGWIRFYGLIYGLAGFIMDRLLRYGLLRYDRILCPARWFAAELKRHPRIAAIVKCVPNGINLADHAVASPPKPGGPVRLMCVGRLVETKGHRYLIQAVSELKTWRRQIHLEIIGDGPLKSSLQNRIERLGLGSHVMLKPPMSHEELLKRYAQDDLFVMPSVFEGFPITLIEAMASRLPIVATRIPGVTDILDDHTAVLAEPEKASDLAEKIRWAIEHPNEVADNVRRAYEMVKGYGWDRIAIQEIEH
jgi:glycosyltransferase involved in cell wall biosynthesis